MSLSEMTPVKITYNTAQDISDEILGGTIQFCRETGYKQNMTVITFLWSAFLFTAKNELCAHNLIEMVMDRYTRSLSNIFPVLFKDEQMRRKVAEIQRQYWNQLLPKFSTISTDVEISTVIQIANRLNTQDGTVSINRSNTGLNKTFMQISNAINSSVFCILRQIDNGMIIQYKGILDQFRYARARQETVNTTYTNNINKQKTSNNAGTVILKVIGALFLGVITAELLLVILLGEQTVGISELVILVLATIPCCAFYIWLFLRNSKQEKKSNTYVANTTVQYTVRGGRTNYCTKCGTRIINDGSFCHKCGTKVTL